MPVRRLAFLLGLVLPMAAFVGIAHLAGEQAAAAHLHVERIQAPGAGLAVVPLGALGPLPEPVAEALERAAQGGAVDLPMTASVRLAWERLAELAGDRTPVVIDVHHVFVLVEARIPDGPIERWLAALGGTGEKMAALWRR